MVVDDVVVGVAPDAPLALPTALALVAFYLAHARVIDDADDDVVANVVTAGAAAPTTTADVDALAICADHATPPAAANVYS